jgi:hypothetical protein
MLVRGPPIPIKFCFRNQEIAFRLVANFEPLQGRPGAIRRLVELGLKAKR